jgi:hypothetical protein
VNPRFVGTWLLDSYETRLPDGTVAFPWGQDPMGIIFWDASGYFAVQVGPREGGSGPDYLSFFGTATADEGEAGRLVLSVQGSSLPSRFNGDQHRDFEFIENGLLRLRPPATPNGMLQTLIWRRAPGRA